MAVVLVHGVPETPAVWAPLREHLGRRDVVAPALPGFGTQRPEGFGSTKEEYVSWLVGELEGLDGPIDLVGHDWGGGFTVRLVSTRPDLIRSWVTDAAAIGDESFEWHEFAKIWQTPGAGEEFFEQQAAADPEQLAELYAGMFSIPKERAVEMARWRDELMADSILRLYRSAVDVGKEWGPDFHDIPAPGLVLVPSEDPFLSADGARTGARRSGARVAELPGIGHWWMLQDPGAGARVLEDFWRGLAN
jgi:pimeloyl-ACP methyl ester carboxylesterase